MSEHEIGNGATVVKGRDGKIVTNLGAGATTVPVERREAGAGVPYEQGAATEAGVPEVWGAYTAAHPDPVTPPSEALVRQTLADVAYVMADPKEAVHQLDSLDRLGLDAADTLMELREREVDSRTSLTFQGQENAKQFRDRTAQIHMAIVRAREELRQARAHVEGDYISPAVAGYTSVLEADALSAEATDLADAIREAEDNGDTHAQARLAAASRHILTARKAVQEALNRSRF
jgi:hypothetical protein